MIRQNDQSAFLALEALHTLDQNAFDSIDIDARCRIYVAALVKSQHFNAWGLPGEYTSKSGRHLVSLGRAAIPHLLPYLDDRRRAPIWGSEEATVDAQYQNRVCDHAAVLLAAILGIEYEHVRDPSARDGNILRLKEQLDV